MQTVQVFIKPFGHFSRGVQFIHEPFALGDRLVGPLEKLVLHRSITPKGQDLFPKPEAALLFLFGKRLLRLAAQEGVRDGSVQYFPGNSHDVAHECFCFAISMAWSWME